MTKFNLLLSEFAQQHHLGALSDDEQGVYHIVIDDMEVRCFEKLDQGYLCAELMTLPAPAATLPPILKDLLHHALARAKSQRCRLALGEAGDLILVASFDIATLKLAEFSERLEKFANALEEYKHFISVDNVARAPSAAMIITP